MANDQKQRQLRRQTLRRVLSARWLFFQNLCKSVENLPNLTTEHHKLLSSERCFQLAEFFALLDLHQVDDTQKLDKFIDAHNEGIDDYQRQIQEDPNAGAIFDISPQRLRRVKFSSQAKENACSLFEISKCFDQSDLSRFVYHYMSEETCRKVIEGLAGIGLMQRRKVGSSLVVKSSGALETAYFTYLDAVEGDSK